MKKIYTTEQIRAWDAYTIEHEPIASVELMNRAALVFTDWFLRRYTDSNRPVYIVAGTGNNGGDGLAAARYLHRAFYAVKVFVCDFSGKHSADFDAQAALLPDYEGVDVQWLSAPTDFPEIPANAVLIDALFGSGLTRAPEGSYAAVIEQVNRLRCEVVAIDLPSGLFADRPTPGPCVRARRTFSFESPKLAFFFPENAEWVGEWEIGSIGLHPHYAEQTASLNHLVEAADIEARVRPRPRFAHKGTFGHALLVAGSYGKMGAAVLAARAALRAGLGLLTVHAPRCGNMVLQTAVPEAMYSADHRARLFSEAPDLERYTALGVGPGLGTAPETAAGLIELLQRARQPLVLDADALNILATTPDCWKLAPAGSVLTPHPGEFERLFGACADSFVRLERLREKARNFGLYIVLKGAYTVTADPEGNCWFNPTGNPGMATGGSGDVLTGILTALLAQGYPPLDACLVGVYKHGEAGDRAAAARGMAAMVAGDIIDSLI